MASLAAFLTFSCILLPVVVQGACTVSSTGINFGAYNPLDTVSLDSQGPINVSCTANSQVRMSIGASPTSGGFNPRKINRNGGGDTLNYNLFTTSGRTVIWGDGTQGTSVLNQSVKKNTPWNATVYGRIPVSQDVYSGQYGESLVVQIDY